MSVSNGSAGPPPPEHHSSSSSDNDEIKIEQTDSSDNEISKINLDSNSSSSSYSKSQKSSKSSRSAASSKQSKSARSNQPKSQQASAASTARSKKSASNQQNVSSSQSKSSHPPKDIKTPKNNANSVNGDANAGNQYSESDSYSRKDKSQSQSYSKNSNYSQYSQNSQYSQSTQNTQNTQNAQESQKQQKAKDLPANTINTTNNNIPDISIEEEEEEYSYEEGSQQLHSINHESTESPTNECQELISNRVTTLLQEPDLSTRIFQYKSIADSILRSINMFREASLKSCFQEDERLYQIAMEHSKNMACGDVPCDAKKIGRKIQPYPFVYYCAHVAHYSSMDNAFTNVINLWTTDPKMSKTLLANFNCSGVGVCLSKTDEVYFTLILGLRSTIGYSFYSGNHLKSILLAEKCEKIANEIRTKGFQLHPFKLDLDLCEHAFHFAKMEIKELSKELIEKKVGICSLYKISFSEIKFKGCTPKTIVQKWMNQLGKAKTILGDFNRVGFGFAKKGLNLYSVSIYTRTLHAAVIDGTETIMDGTIIANQISEILNEFRMQHSLPAMSLDPDLCQAAQEHTEYIANGQEGLNPLDDEYYSTSIETQYEATDISHMCCNEISRAPKAFMAKWRNNVDCISVLLNQVDDVGVGVCFDKDYVCHITVIIGSRGNQAAINNIIVKL